MNSNLFLLALVFIISCEEMQNKKDMRTMPGKRDTLPIAKFDTSISKNQAFREMEKQKEVWDIDAMDSTLKRSSNVNYCISYGDRTSANCSMEYNCIAFFFSSDTLRISIDINSGLGGNGIHIRYKDGAFSIIPMYWTDVHDELAKDPVFNIKEQV